MQRYVFFHNVPCSAFNFVWLPQKAGGPSFRMPPARCLQPGRAIATGSQPVRPKGLSG